MQVALLRIPFELNHRRRNAAFPDAVCPKRNADEDHARGWPAWHEKESEASYPRAHSKTIAASAQFSAKIEMQSSERHTGTVPAVLMAPRVGLIPTIPLNAATTEPEPSTSVPKVNDTRPAATATAEPELEPPEISFVQYARACTIGRARAREPHGELIKICLSHRNRVRDHQLRDHRCRPSWRVSERRTSRRCGSPGQVDIVLDCERNSVRGSSSRNFPMDSARAIVSSSGTRWIHVGRSPCSRIRRYTSRITPAGANWPYR
jgi:hypothetical protein